MLRESLNKIAHDIHEDNRKKGFWDDEREVGTLLMLVVSELSEALEAHRKDRFANWEQFRKDIMDGVEKDDAFRNNIKDTFEDEIADAMIRLFDLSGALGISIEDHIMAKLKYNRSRPHKHGKKY